jgi:hypothetical protein
VAAGITTPLDVAKTMLQTRGTSNDVDIRNVGGMTDAFRIIWRRDGIRGFGRGLTPRVLTIMPSTALCWLSYEFFSEQHPFLMHKFVDDILSIRGSHSNELIDDVVGFHGEQGATLSMFSSNGGFNYIIYLYFYTARRFHYRALHTHTLDHDTLDTLLYITKRLFSS